MGVDATGATNDRVASITRSAAQEETTSPPVRGHRLIVEPSTSTSANAAPRADTTVRRLIKRAHYGVTNDS